MAGRGYLKSRLAQIASKENGVDNGVTSEEPPKTYNISKTPIPAVSNGAIVDSRPQAARGRRATLSQIAQQLVLSDNTENMALKFSSLELGNSKDIRCQTPTVPPVCESNHKLLKLPVLTKQPQSQSVENLQYQSVTEASKEEKAPVICRVPETSKKDNYRMTQLSSNYIKMEINKNQGIFMYNVSFHPPVDSKSTKFYLLNGHRELFPVKTFDGSLLYIPTKLPQNVTILTGKLKDGTEITMKITFNYKVSVRECIQFYNIFLRSVMKILGLVQFNRYNFDPKKKIFVPEYKLEIWPGFLTAIDEFENGLYLCCDISHRVLRVETVLQTLIDIGAYSKKRESDVKQEIMAALCNTTVITRYTNKTYKIDDIDFTMTPLSTFKHNNTELSFVEYYKKVYDIEIKDLKQPMIITKPKKRDIEKGTDICCLVPELCNLTGLTENMKSNMKLMKAIHVYTTVTPEMRQEALVEFVNNINEHEEASQKFKNWGITLLPVPVQLEGPVYKRETVILGNNIKKGIGINMDWGLDVAKNAMFTATNMKNWAILHCPRDGSLAKSFCSQLATCGCELGMSINAPIVIVVEGSSPEAFVSVINNTLRCNYELQLVVIIFPNQREDRYNAVKRICCAEIGIPSQVIISKTLSRPDRLRSITQKIALQINCKLGGACWAIDIPLKNTMIVGIDTYHDANKNMSSVVGFVASMDITFTQWYSVAGIQKSTHEEIMHNIHLAMRKVLEKYNDKNGLLPERIIIYRDGVGDGDLKLVEKLELCNLEESFKGYSGNYCPKITFIIVQKRINTRIFQFLNEKYSNPSPGTVIDNTVTRRNYFDFFLVSQHVRQGTVNPTHYIVLKNGCNLSVENIQRLSYKLCHLYYNWCGTIKVPAPIQYAHKLAYLIGQNIRRMPNEKLCDSLFFL